MKYTKSLFAMLAMGLSGPLFAGNAESVTITKFGSGSGYESICGVLCVPIKVSPQHTNFTGCSKYRASWDFALDTSTEGGKQAYAHLYTRHP